MGMLKRTDFYTMWEGKFEQVLIDILLDLLGQTIKVDLGGEELPGDIIDKFTTEKINREPLLNYLRDLGHSNKKIHDSFEALAKEEKDFNPKDSAYSVQVTAGIIKAFATIKQAIQGQLPSGSSGDGKLAEVTDNAIEIALSQGLTFGENALIELAEIAIADAYQIAAELNNLKAEALGHLLQKGQHELINSLRRGALNTEYNLDAKQILRNKGLLNGVDYSAPLSDIGGTIIERVKDKEKKRQEEKDWEQEQLRQSFQNVQKRRGIQ